jgi:hypothetical protein
VAPKDFNIFVVKVVFVYISQETLRTTLGHLKIPFLVPKRRSSYHHFCKKLAKSEHLSVENLHLVCIGQIAAIKQ